MQDFWGAFGSAFSLIAAFEAELVEIVLLSIYVTGVAVALSCVIAFPLGAALAVAKFPGRGMISAIVNASMGLPPVVIGLLVYMMLSQSGPLAVLNLLYTPTAMIIAQFILVTPIVTALTRQVVEDLNAEYADLLRVMKASRFQIIVTLLRDARSSLSTAALAGFGRAFAEVGAVMIVGGNINHMTRVMTTAIALETSKGDLELALALGIVLLLISFAINGALMMVQSSARKMTYG